ncbi:hypothetical protein ACQ7RN_004518 [Escherichia coli]
MKVPHVAEKKTAPERKEKIPGKALFRFLAHSLTTFGRWDCGERSHLTQNQ